MSCSHHAQVYFDKNAVSVHNLLIQCNVSHCNHLILGQRSAAQPGLPSMLSKTRCQFEAVNWCADLQARLKHHVEATSMPFTFPAAKEKRCCSTSWYDQFSLPSTLNSMMRSVTVNICLLTYQQSDLMSHILLMTCAYTSSTYSTAGKGKQERSMPFGHHIWSLWKRQPTA